MERIETLQRSGKAITGVPSGFVDLDGLTSGFQRAELVVVAARPSMGKTAFCLNIAANAASRGARGRHLLAGNVEGVAGAAHAHAPGAGGQPPGAAGHRSATPTSPSSPARPAFCRRYQIWIDDTPSITLLEMRSKARRLKIDNDLKLVVVDYLQLMRSPEYSENRVQEISDISRSLKALARELEIPVIALSQLSRASEQRGGERKPILSDLRDSGAIEQDADLVIFIHRPEYYDREDESKRGRRRDHAGQEPQRSHRRRPAQASPASTPASTTCSDRDEPEIAWHGPRSVYRCTECGHEHAKWVGRCEGCGAWNAVAEEPVAARAAAAVRRSESTAPAARPPQPPDRLRNVATEPLARWRTGHQRVRLRARRRDRAGLDDPHRRRAGHRQVHAAAPGRRAAGGGGPHGALRQRRGVARPDPAPGRSPDRRRRGGARARRDAARGDRRARPARSRPTSVVIDSIQTVYTDTLESAPGNVGQVRECSGQLMRFAKESGTAVIVVGHVTKGGGIAGPKTLEHIVDTVLYFEGEVTLDYRLLRTTKNRFGSVDELGVFSMTEQGLVAGAQPVGRVPGRAGRRHQRQRRHRADGRHSAGAGGSPGARRQVRLRHSPAGGHRARSQAARRAAGGARAPGANLLRATSTSSCRSRPAFA